MDEGQLSWSATAGTPVGLVVALYVRDAAGLDVRHAHGIPPLDPAVPVDAALAPLATIAAAAAWPAWWAAELDADGDPLDLVLERAAAVDPELGLLADACSATANRWLRERNREHVESLRPRSGGRRPMPLNDAVAAVESARGRRAEPFRLKISVLPVAGPWGTRVRADSVLVGRHLFGDAERYRAFLDPIVRELA